MKNTFYMLLLISLLSCKEDDTVETYGINGRVTTEAIADLEGIKIYYNDTEYTLTDASGHFTINDLAGAKTIWADSEQFDFSPASHTVEMESENINFVATRVLGEEETQVLQWLSEVQLENGLLPSIENGTVVSLYDNALAALVFLAYGEIEKAEDIFNYFESKIVDELEAGLGGFSQLRSPTGVPNNHKWMGDNAWLLIALNAYRSHVSDIAFEELSESLENWLISLQDSDGGLFAGYNASGQLLNYKVTEGNIDAFNAIKGYTNFHSDLIQFLKEDRWDEADQNLVAWVDNPTYLYAMDLHPWSYCIFEDYPVSALTSADRYLTTQTATINGASITGYSFDEDKDVVWFEGTGQMALAFRLAGMETEANYYMNEMEKVLVASPTISNGFGFPYASNPGTAYGAGALWSTADTEPAISGGAWYLFAKLKFNPFEAGIKTEMPQADMFWK